MTQLSLYLMQIHGLIQYFFDVIFYEYHGV